MNQSADLVWAGTGSGGRRKGDQYSKWCQDWRYDGTDAVDDTVAGNPLESSSSTEAIVGELCFRSHPLYCFEDPPTN